jgi:hypothetical protein
VIIGYHHYLTLVAVESTNRLMYGMDVLLCVYDSHTAISNYVLTLRLFVFDGLLYTYNAIGQPVPSAAVHCVRSAQVRDPVLDGQTEPKCDTQQQ